MSKKDTTIPTEGVNLDNNGLVNYYLYYMEEIVKYPVYTKL